MATKRTYAQLTPEQAHPAVSARIRILEDIGYDAQDAVTALDSQLVGGAMAFATFNAGAVVPQLTSGGYYKSNQPPPTVTVTGNGNGAKFTPVMKNNRVVGLQGSGGTGYTSATITFTP